MKNELFTHSAPEMDGEQITPPRQGLPGGRIVVAKMVFHQTNSFGKPGKNWGLRFTPGRKKLGSGTTRGGGSIKEPRMKTPVQTTKKSHGTVIAEKARAKANKYTDEKRSDLIEQGMAIILNPPTTGCK